MKLTTSGKHLDTTPIRGLFRQGEEKADEITIELPAQYGEQGLSSLLWCVRGREESGYMAEQLLPALASEGKTLLTWKVGKPLTNLSGAVRLELCGSSPEGDTVVKLGGDSIYIAPALSGTAPPETLDNLFARLLALEQTIRRDGEGNQYLADDGTYKRVQGVSPARYRKRFTPEDFKPRLARFLLYIPPGEHRLGTAVFVPECLRDNGEGYGSILYQYNTLPDGGVAVLSDEPFAGEIIVEGL